VVAHNRRGFGRSSQHWGGYDYDTFADDLATIFVVSDQAGAVRAGDDRSHSGRNADRRRAQCLGSGSHHRSRQRRDRRFAGHRRSTATMSRATVRGEFEADGSQLCRPYRSLLARRREPNSRRPRGRSRLPQGNIPRYRPPALIRSGARPQIIVIDRTVGGRPRGAHANIHSGNGVAAFR
jgi:hypothetical protein